MALIVEDGTGLAAAESYISVTNADTYFANRGNTAWPLLTVPQKEQALRKATDWIEGKYSDDWKGHRVQFVQALSWPRYGAKVNGYYLFSNYVPLQITYACAELAVRASAIDLSTDFIGPVVFSEEIGPIKTTYATGATRGAEGARTKNEYEAIEDMLSSFIDGGGNMVKLVRG